MVGLLLFFAISCTDGEGTGTVTFDLEPDLAIEVTIGDSSFDIRSGDRIDIEVGRQQLCFSSIPGYREPPCRDIEVSAGTATQVTVVYRPISGAPEGSGETDPIEPAPQGEPADDEPDRISHGSQLRPDMVGPRSTLDPAKASGPMETEADGQVIEDLAISVSGLQGIGIHVRHDDVTIRDVHVIHAQGANGIVIEPDIEGTRIEHSLFDGSNSSHRGNFGSVGIVSYGPDTHVHRAAFRNMRDGVHLYCGRSSVTESYLSDFHQGAGFHNDGLHHRGSDSKVTFARNHIVYDGGESAAITIYPDRGPAVDVRIVDNYIEGAPGNRGFGLYGGWSHAERDGNRDVRIEGNLFSGSFQYPDVLGEGTNAAVNLSRPGHTFTDNRWVGGSSDLRARCGITSDSC